MCFRYVCKKFDTDEELDQEYCRSLRAPREETRKCFKKCAVIIKLLTVKHMFDLLKFNRKHLPTHLVLTTSKPTRIVDPISWDGTEHSSGYRENGAR